VALLKHLHQERWRDHAPPAPKEKQKTPARCLRWGLVRTHTARTGAGGFGSLGARHFSTLSRIAFPNLCQIAHKVGGTTNNPKRKASHVGRRERPRRLTVAWAFRRRTNFASGLRYVTLILDRDGAVARCMLLVSWGGTRGPLSQPRSLASGPRRVWPPRFGFPKEKSSGWPNLPKLGVARFRRGSSNPPKATAV
jgi:hypothetical protein